MNNKTNPVSKFRSASGFILCGIFLAGCGGNNTENSTDVSSDGSNSNTVTISGQAFDDFIVAGDVRIINLSGTELGATSTGNDGQYSFEVQDNDIANGYDIVVSGGQMAGDPFTGTLRARYFSADEKSSANVTLITSLVYELSERITEGAAPAKRSAAIQTLVDIGMLEPDEWSRIDPASVNVDDLQEIAHQLGADEWVAQMAAELSDGELSGNLMLGFPNAHGGLVDAQVGDGNRIRVFKGRAVQEFVSLIPYSSIDSASYAYVLIDEPAGLSVGGNGVVSFSTLPDASTEEIDFQIKITNTTTSKSRTIAVVTHVMDTEVIASGVIDQAGGTIADEWEEVILTIPEGAVLESSTIQVLRAVDENGQYVYTTESSVPLQKVLQLRLPDPNLRAPGQSIQPNAQTQAIRKQATTASLTEQKTKPVTVKVAASRLSDGWVEWGMPQYARFIEIKQAEHRNAKNRVRNELPAGLQPPSHNKIVIHNSIDASRLYSLCGTTESYNNHCDGRSPVLFIHGYSVRGDHGGGEDTWGILPELIEAEGYAVFQFTWRTTARFKDAADDLADAIEKIQVASGKKVHLVAHSFGGLLARTYLQNRASERLYSDDVQSLVTLGSPHSGIFGADGTYHDVSFLKGQDSGSFNGCLQVSCNQAGEPTPRAYSFTQLGIDFDLSIWFGVNVNAGELPALLSDTSGIHAVPVDTLVLIGLTIDRAPLLFPTIDSYNVTGPDTYQTGDALISFAGQRFLPSLANQATSDNPVYESNGISVTEKLLGISHGAIPGGDVPVDEAFRADGRRIDFEGYRHSQSNVGQGGIGITNRGSAGEPHVKDSGALLDTAAQHAALIELKQWLLGRPSEAAASEVLILNLQTTDASTGEPVEGAEVGIGTNGAIFGNGRTDSSGNLTVEVPFRANTSYTAYASAAGYHQDEFNTGYTTGVTSDGSSSNFGRIELQPDQAARGSLGGQITDAVTGQSLDGVNFVLDRNGLERTGVTDASGGYLVTDLVRGNYALRLSRSGYRDSLFRFDVQPDQINPGNASLRQILVDGQMSVRLTWDVNPRDLDSHLTKYDASGNQQYHIYYAARTDTLTGDNLDLDDVSSYGPETTTIQTVDPLARYVFAVYHFSGSGSITTTSDAQVTIDYGSENPMTLFAPTSGSGRWWKVFEINNGEILPCQSDCILDSGPTRLSVPMLPLPSESQLDTSFQWLRDMHREIGIKDKQR